MMRCRHAHFRERDSSILLLLLQFFKTMWSPEGQGKKLNIQTKACSAPFLWGTGANQIDRRGGAAAPDSSFWSCFECLPPEQRQPAFLCLSSQLGGYCSKGTQCWALAHLSTPGSPGCSVTVSDGGWRRQREPQIALRRGPARLLTLFQVAKKWTSQGCNEDSEDSCFFNSLLWLLPSRDTCSLAQSACAQEFLSHTLSPSWLLFLWKLTCDSCRV